MVLLHEGREVGRGQLAAGNREHVHGWKLLDGELVVEIIQTIFLQHPTYGYALEEKGFMAWDSDDLVPLESD